MTAMVWTKNESRKHFMNTVYARGTSKVFRTFLICFAWIPSLCTSWVFFDECACLLHLPLPHQVFGMLFCCTIWHPELIQDFSFSLWQQSGKHSGWSECLVGCFLDRGLLFKCSELWSNNVVYWSIYGHILSWMFSILNSHVSLQLDTHLDRLWRK